jgi:adenylate cyclase
MAFQVKAIRKKPAKKSKNKKPAKSAAKRARAKNLRALPGGNGISQTELLLLRDLNEFTDELLEESSRSRLSLRATLDRLLPAISQKLGAAAALLQTCNEDLVPELFEFGTWSKDDRATWSATDLAPAGKTSDGKRTLIAQRLDVAGETVGTLAFAFAGDRTADAAILARRIHEVAEELDGVLAAIQLASLKQDVILRVQQSLKNLVFERGVDDAVFALQGALPLRDLVLVYHDDAAVSATAAIRYRVYKDGVCTADSESHPNAKLAELIARKGRDLLGDEGTAALQQALALTSAVETVLISGITTARVLGKIEVTSLSGLSTFGRDLLRVFAECISQRLVDYNRERRHLSQFFSPVVINELLRDAAYHERWLSPRTDEVAILYADINSFTKISEQVLLEPGKIGRFVDRWSQGAVEILWKHGGVFDKMVGDCVIGIFGPPFFRNDRVARIAAAVKAAREILSFTVGLEHDADLASIVTSGVVPGLGVAVGLNLCPASVGLFGPNQDFTAFSSGMNQTARLQSLAGFREILVMDSARDYVAQSTDAALRDATYEGPAESPVKNVAKPLRFYRVKFPEMLKPK